MAEIIAVANQKGGIGKTTTALALADALNMKGKKTLYVDLDPQCNGTGNYRAKVDGVGTLYDLLVDGDTDCIQTTERGDIIAGDPLLKEASKVIDGASATFKLKKGLSEIRNRYDYIILDTPPALSVLLTNALTAADKVIIPLTTDLFGLQGLTQLHDTIIEVQEFTNPELKVDGLLLVKYKDRTNLSKEILATLPEYAKLLNTRIYETKIREAVATQEAQAARESLFTWAPSCTTAKDYLELLNEIVGGDING
jgi:chromosome partitioning protein